VNHHDIHHVIEAMNELCHDLLDDFGLQLPMLHFQELFKVVTITELHEDVVPIVSLYRLLHLSCKLAADHILVVDFVHDELFFVCRQLFAINDLACQKLWVWNVYLILYLKLGRLLFLLGLLFWLFWQLLREINFAKLSMAE